MTRSVPMIAAALLMLVAPASFCAETEVPDYAKTIPPEILAKYDPGLVDGTRPKIVTITQDMIWSLRTKPDQGGDIYTLDVKASELSTVQKNVVLEWIKAGHNVLIQEEQCVLYWELFPGFTEPKEAKNCPGPLPVTLSEHPVNTDCANVTFCTTSEGRLRRSDNTYGIGHTHLYYPALPEHAVVVASLDRGRRSDDPGGPVAGCVPYGRGGVYFIIKPPQGSDTDRWTLSFRQWMLGLPIPGAADISSREAAPHRLVLQNGDSIRGTVLTPSVTVKTGYAELTFDMSQVETLRLDNGNGAESVVLSGGDTLSGRISPDAFKVKLPDGREIEIAAKEIKEINVRG